MADHVNVPSVSISSADAASQADTSNDYFNSKEWTDAWGIQKWNNSANLDDGDARILMVNSPANVYFDANTDINGQSGTYLTLRTARLDEFQTAAEFESTSQTYQYLSARMYARTVGPSGAITAMFTYRGSDDPNAIQESDLEIRTMDPPDVIQYTNQPSYSRTGDAVDQATRNATVPVGWDDWAVHRMDWSPEDTTWYVDGVNVSQISFQTPRDPSYLIFNSWSDGANWSGNMSVGDEAYLQIQWIELVYNSTAGEQTSDDSNGRKRGLLKRENACKKVCSIDETHTLGTPVLLQGDAWGLRSGVLSICIPLLAVAALQMMV
ncbi:hypothetical protein TruAng_002858 [Truncatella angustata]|nr:hypothetical protein TruAng_002858 [Truncatella angustata]